jgi:hypothetical protein
MGCKQEEAVKPFGVWNVLGERYILSLEKAVEVYLMILSEAINDLMQDIYISKTAERDVTRLKQNFLCYRIAIPPL